MVPSTVLIPLERAFLLTTSGTSKRRVEEPLAFAVSGCRMSRALKRKTDGSLFPILRFFMIQYPTDFFLPSRQSRVAWRFSVRGSRALGLRFRSHESRARSGPCRKNEPAHQECRV